MYNGQHQGPSPQQPLCVYVSQHDLHHAEMTVKETLDFSARMFGTENESSKYLIYFFNLLNMLPS